MSSTPDFLVHGLLAGWLLPPFLMLALAAAASWLKSPAKLDHCWRFSQLVMLASLVCSMVLGGALALGALTGQPMDLSGGAQPFGLYPDGISIWMAMMVTLVAWVILRFADTYLRSDPGRHRFLPWFLVIVCSVLVLTSTNHLLVLAFAWVIVSLALHHLLTLYPDRPEARLAAVQKFLVSRLGDVMVLCGVFLLYSHHGSFLLPDIIAGVEAGTGAGVLPTLASVAFALAAVIKCAQIPFHGWLLRVMEAPTPVSAVLHAGVINLGGFLWLRLFPAFDGYTAGHMILLVVGGLTAVVAVITMMTQYSVKHALAWSTCAQMGFMLFEVGLGAYTLALLHLVAHSLYKAHSFLATGRTVAASANRPFAPATAPTRLLRAAVSAGVATIILILAPQIVQHNAVLGAVLVLAVGAAASGIPADVSPGRVLMLCGLAVSVVPCYFLLHALLAPMLSGHAMTVGALPLMAQVTGWVFIVALVALTLLTQLSTDHPRVRRLRNAFSHGLSLERPLDRLTQRLASRALRAPVPVKRVAHHPFRMEDPS